MPSLRISYDYLPLYLKQCFKYFALFPEDYRFNNLEVTNFWTAIGIIDKDKNYMEELVDNGFLMKENDDLEDQHYVLHDLLHVLSRSVSSQECLNICSSLNFRADAIPRSIRHLSVTMEDKYEDNFSGEMIKLRRKIDILNLRTLMIFRDYDDALDEILKETFKEIKCVRVLFIVVKPPKPFPCNFSNLIHLRYLKIASNFSSEITLPSTLSRFYHMKLLDLRDWQGSDKLPTDISRLVNLSHFFAKNGLHSNVPEIGKIKCLHELKEFCVKKEYVGFELKQLGELTELEGELNIHNLEKVATKDEAMEAKLVLKRDLKKLRLSWSTDHQHTTESDVLDGLEPHPNLAALEIVNHGGSTSRPPHWLCGDISTPNLVSLHLEGLSWDTLPPFWQLKLLISLTLRNISGVRQISTPGFDALKLPSGRCFVHLKYIVLDGLPNLIEWAESVPNSHAFSRLEYISCSRCPNLLALPFLVECPPGSYAHLFELKISDCPKLCVPPMPHISTLTSFSVEHSSSSRLSYTSHLGLSLTSYTGALAFHNMYKVEWMFFKGVSHIPLSELTKLRTLCFAECNITCHGLQNFTSLQEFAVENCGNFFRWHIKTPFFFHASLRELEIIEESSIRSMSLLSNLTSLTKLWLRSCKNLTVDGFNPLAIVNLKDLDVYNRGIYPVSIAADILSELLVAARTMTKLASPFHQLERLSVDCISAVFVDPICSLMAATVKDLSIWCDHRTESLTEEEKALELLTSLQSLQFCECLALLSLPQGLHNLSSLRLLRVINCPRIRPRPNERQLLPTSLQKLYLRGCSAELQEHVEELQATNPDLQVDMLKPGQGVRS
uniref:NBS-LRR resistance-like protein n=1 Tax=Hordeum vulgare subsp. vulgare TaxID=112509 RepID=A0A8I7BFT8_HORVV